MDDYPKYRSHLLPRTRDGWVGTVAFLAILALAMPPVTHVFLNRLEPVILGMPFLYAVLMGVYFALVAVLIWVYRKGV